MTTIANPIYDSVFKFMLEDERVARILLSALLKKEVRDLEMRSNEYTNLSQTRISLFRLDFTARIEDNKGMEHLVLIELQKTWLSTETLRFRQYLGTQYLNDKNMVKQDNPRGYGLPIITIYILGHKLGDLQQPVVYVRRRYLDYDNIEITEGVPDPFIESLTHDSIIVQVPYLKGRSRNRLERLLKVFDQENKDSQDPHLLNINDEGMEAEERLLVDRLMRAAISSDIRRSMSVEDEILSEIEARDTTIMMKDKTIAQKDETIALKDETIALKDETIAQKDETIALKDETIALKDETIALKDDELQRKNDMLRSAALALHKKGLSIEELSAILIISADEARALLGLS